MEWTTIAVIVCAAGLVGLFAWGRRSYRQFTQLPPERRRRVAPKVEIPDAGDEAPAPARSNSVAERAAAWEQARTTDPRAHDRYGVTTVIERPANRIPPPK